MANFLGFKQVLLSTYMGLTDEQKKHYLWLVREEASGATQSAAIYFGTRLYAQMNEVDGHLTELVDNMLASLGDALDENGEFVGWLPVHPILASAETMSSAFELLESAILENKESLVNVAGRVATIETGLTDINEEIAQLESDLDALADNVYSKEEIDEKIDELEEKFAGVFHFKGTVATVEDLPTGASIGDVWQVLANNGEYAWNGEEWVELGSTVDLSNYYTKAETIAQIASAVSIEAAAREELADKVDELDTALDGEIERVDVVEGRLTLSANTYEEATALTMDYGQIVYILNDEVGPSGHTAGAYVKTQAGLKKIEATNGDGSDVEDRVEALENKVGDTPLPSGTTITEAVAELLADDTHVISGDDVEE